MTKVTYVGGHDDGNAGTVSMAGIVFPLNKAVDVKDARMIEKLKGNRFFDVEGVDKPPVAERHKAAAPSESDAEHDDGDTDDSGVHSTASRSSRMRR
jgi:hypothetical protein